MSKLQMAVAAGVMLIAAAAIALFILTRTPEGYGERHAERVFSDCAACPEMIEIPAGAFRMGDEGGRRRFILSRLGLAPSRREQIDVGAFAISTHEITFEQWDACVADGGCEGYTPPDEGWGRGARPVINVSWRDARAFARWLSEKTGRSYRLVREAEWEYAARAGTDTSYPWGWLASHDRANYGAPQCPPCTGATGGRDQFVNTAPVGQFPPNRFGVFDSQGNVYEWVEECMYMTAAPDDGDTCAARVIRGGAWYSDPNRIRVNYRAHSAEHLRSKVIGFRVARDM